MSAQSDHDRVLSSGAWFGAFVFACLMGWIDAQVPRWAGFLVTWTVIIAVFYAIARYKRAWYAWLSLYATMALFLVCITLNLIGVLNNNLSFASFVVAGIGLFIYYWLIRMPKLQTVAAKEIHHIHHVVHHGLPNGYDVPGYQLEDRRPVTLSGTVRKALPQVRKALTGGKENGSRIVR